jgi:MurE/MurF fusion protein
MKLGQLFPAAAVGRSFDVEVAGVASDSRKVKAGFVFIAVPGTVADGMSFIPDAIKNGAIAIVGEGSIHADIPSDIIYMKVPNARRILALIAAAIHSKQPETIVAITGTAGKTSVADFVRQIYIHCGKQAASVGTIGIITSKGAAYGSLTTPDPVALHETLNRLASSGITHLAIEASSHGLNQSRLDGVRLSAAAFTNLGRDHLDYHATMEEYLAAKMRLFDTLMKTGQPVVINADGDRSADAITTAFARGLKIFSVGENGLDIKILNIKRENFAQKLTLKYQNKTHKVILPLVGEFQAGNALVAAGLAIVTGCEAEAVFKALEQIKGVKGRLEHVGDVGNAPVFVDYAHKPEALQHALQAVRPFTKGKLIVVFGCGGDRDAGKRAIMGRIASDHADLVIVTDDNPRTEDSAVIRANILAAVPKATEIGDRLEAIQYAVNQLQNGDCLIIAGKGHEEGQIIGTQVLPFSDQAVAIAAIAEAVKNIKPQDVKQDIKQEVKKVKPAQPKEVETSLWTAQAIIDATGAQQAGDLKQAIMGISIDTRTLQKGDLYVAIKGDALDGHDYVEKAFANGAAAALVSNDHMAKFKGCAFGVPDTLRAMEQLGIAARARTDARIIAVTGSVGKTSTKEALLHILSEQGRTHASVLSYNNHWGVPLTLARMPKDTQFGIFEIGMSAAGEITPLSGFVRPHVAMITTVEPVHLAQFEGVEAIADAKGEIFGGLEQGGIAVLPKDNPHYERLHAHAKASKAANIVSFGTDENADARLIKLNLQPSSSMVEASINGKLIAYKLGAPGKHMVMNSLGILASVEALGGDLALAGLALASFTPTAGRGARTSLNIKNGTFALLDESYNANPASMRAAFDVLGRIEAGKRGRRIAILGDMLELGAESAAMHAALKEPLESSGIDLVLACGPLSKHLFDALKPSMRCFYAENSQALEAGVFKIIRAGDVVMVKGSNGSKMSQIVAALKETYGVSGA